MGLSIVSTPAKNNATLDESECDPPLRTRVTAAEMREPGGAAEEGNAGISHDARPLERICAGVVNEPTPTPTPTPTPALEPLAPTAAAAAAAADTPFASSPALEAATYAAIPGSYHDEGGEGEGEDEGDSGEGGGRGEFWLRRKLSLIPPGVRNPPHTVNLQYASPGTPPPPTPPPTPAPSTRAIHSHTFFAQIKV